MSIDEQPMNVYWSGKRTETSNTFKITDKGSVAEYTDLPSSGNQKGDKYEVTDDGSDYIWDGSTWSRLGAEKYAYEDIIDVPDFALDTNVVHKTGDETVAGVKNFTSRIDIADGTGKKFESVSLPTTPASSVSAQIPAFLDSQGKTIAGLFAYYNSNGYHGLVSRLYDPAINAAVEAMSIYENPSNQINISLKISSMFPDSSSTTLGTSSKLWGQIYSSSATISTSDERLKQDVSEIPDAVLDAWGKVGFRQFKMRDAVAQKGDAARLHTGMVAQSIDAAFAATGLDARDYGLFCFDAWDKEDAVLDGNGETVVSATEAGDRYSLRYEEALCMEAAYQRRRADRAEARLVVLEERLSALEARYPE